MTASNNYLVGYLKNVLSGRHFRDFFELQEDNLVHFEDKSKE